MWLYIPNPSTSSPSAPEEPASISASSWQFRALEQSVWSRGKVLRSQHWHRQWKRASWLQRLFGLMPEPSRAAHGVAQWTASLVASVSRLRLDSSLRQRSARRINGKESSSLQWPTATSRDWKDTGSLENVPENCLLGRVAANWPTPRVTTNGGTGNSDRLKQARLEDTASAFSRQKGTGSQSGDASLPSRRILNPHFVEWLMGWPPGWTLIASSASACSGTALSHWKQRMRSALLRLGLPQEAPPAQLALFG